MRNAIAILLLTLSLCRGNQSITLAWDPVTNAPLSGYKVFYGCASRTYTNIVFVGNSTNATISGLADSTWYYFAAVSVATNGLISDYSDEVKWWNGPGAPVILTPWVQLQWQPPLPAQIQASPDFSVWQPVGTSTNGAASDLSSASNLFYRANAKSAVTLKINPAPAP